MKHNPRARIDGGGRFLTARDIVTLNRLSNFFSKIIGRVFSGRANFLRSLWIFLFFILHLVIASISILVYFIFAIKSSVEVALRQVVCSAVVTTKNQFLYKCCE